MENKRFMNAEEVSECLGISTSMAYRIIRRLNKELNECGYLTVAGRVSRSYFEKKFYYNECA